MKKDLNNDRTTIETTATVCPMSYVSIHFVRGSLFSWTSFLFHILCVGISNDKGTKIKAVINSYCFHFGSLSRCKKCSLISSGFFFFVHVIFTINIIQCNMSAIFFLFSHVYVFLAFISILLTSLHKTPLRVLVVCFFFHYFFVVAIINEILYANSLTHKTCFIQIHMKLNEINGEETFSC